MTPRSMSKPYPGYSNPEILYSGRPILCKYSVIAGQEGQTLKWKAEIDEIIGFLKEGKLDALRNSLPENRRLYADLLYNFFNSKEEGEDLILRVLGFFFFKNRPPYLGKMRGTIKLLLGGRYRLDSIFDANGNPTCVDSSCLFLKLASEYGISGKIKSTSKRLYPPRHYYFMADYGPVLDVMIRPSLNRLSFFENEGVFL